MAKRSYSEKLKDPRWQKKRLKILERDEFVCQECGDDKSTLNVHHKNYYPSKEPWECNDNNLITYCNECHEAEHEYKKELDDLIHDLLLKGYTYANIWHDLIVYYNDAK